MKLVPQNAREDGKETARTLSRVFSAGPNRIVEIQVVRTLAPQKEKAC